MRGQPFYIADYRVDFGVHIATQTYLAMSGYNFLGYTRKTTLLGSCSYYGINMVTVKNGDGYATVEVNSRTMVRYVSVERDETEANTLERLMEETREVLRCNVNRIHYLMRQYVDGQRGVRIDPKSLITYGVI